MFLNRSSLVKLPKFDSQRDKPLSCEMQTNFPFRASSWTIFLALLVLARTAQADFPAGKLTPTERLKTAHLKAAHEDAERLQQTRKVLPPVPGLHDYKSILHAHAEDSAHTGGTRPEMLADAKKAGVAVIMLSDHYRPPRDFITDSWRGLHDGVLFIPGSEVRGFLVYPQHSIMNHMDDPEPEFIKTVTQ